MRAQSGCRVAHLKPDTARLALEGKSALMLLYLNKDTWIKDAKLLERDVRAARGLAQGRKLSRMNSNLIRRMSASSSMVKIVLVHENECGAQLEPVSCAPLYVDSGAS